MKRRTETERSTDRSIDSKTPERLPAPPRAPRMPSTPAKPGRRSEAPSDIVVTSRIERYAPEPTPAPLPPSPAAADAEKWFEQVPTNPGAPTTTPGSRRDATGRTPMVAPAQAHAGSGAPTWLFPLLLALTALTVGMVIGALAFGRSSEHAPCPPCDAAGSSTSK
jgi:hypothetical protein